MLIAAATEAVATLGAPLFLLEGDPSYYGRHGFVPAGTLGFRRPSLRVPPAAFQVRPLQGYEPSWMTGTLVYRQAFWDHDSVGLRPEAVEPGAAHGIASGPAPAFTRHHRQPGGG